MERREQEKKIKKEFEENSFPEIERETKKFSQIPRGKNKFLARFPGHSFQLAQISRQTVPHSTVQQHDFRGG